MNIKEFLERSNLAIKNKKKDETLLTHQNKFLRSRLLLRLIQQLSRLLSVFEFKNDIFFKENIPFIIINDLYFKIDHIFHLKKTGAPHLTEVQNTIFFLRKYNINPDLVIDLGACWGEYSLFLAKEYPQCKIFCIEGAKQNFQILKSNLEINFLISKFVNPFNLIISDKNGEAEIMNEINTMNTVKTNNKNIKANYCSVMSKTISTFCIENSIKKIDFLKIDIEGSELKLLNDLLNLPIKSMQIELIKNNSLDENIEFLKKLSYKYQFYNFTSHIKENVDDLIRNLEIHFKNKATIDLFLINHEN